MAKAGGGGGRGSSGRSKGEIKKWSSIVKNLGAAGKMRLTRYLGSLTLGRDFGESTKDYFARAGLTQFDTWAHKALGR